MSTVIIASLNPVKRQAIEGAFGRIFPGSPFHFRSVAVASDVADQPRSDAETLTGARNRAHSARALHPAADYWAGVEGGIEDSPDGMLAMAWIVVIDRRTEGRGRSGSFVLPGAVADLIRGGLELGQADDIVFGRENSKQAEGAVGLLTGKAIDRAALYEQAAVLALIPFRNPALYRAD